MATGGHAAGAGFVAAAGHGGGAAVELKSRAACQTAQRAGQLGNCGATTSGTTRGMWRRRQPTAGAGGVIVTSMAAGAGVSSLSGDELPGEHRASR